MGKKSIILTLSLLVCISTNVYAQGILDITGYRIYKIYTGSATKADAFYVTRSTTEQTELNDNTYLVYELSSVPSNNAEMQPTLLYRQDGQKIYRYDETRQEEVLMFDFSLNEGDVFTTSQGTQMEVVEVGDCKEYLHDWFVLDYPGKKLRLRDCDNTAIEDIWVEGIGSLHTGILPPELIPNARDCSLDFCDMGKWAAVFPQNTPYYKSIQSAPYDILNHEQPEYYNYSFSDDTLVIRGCAVQNSYCFVTSCFIHDNIIDLDDYTVLYYGIDILDGRVLRGFEIKLPGFQPGEYTIMAGGQKLATVVCGTTAINSLEVPAKATHQRHDLLGHPINSLQKGINIVDGKKVWVK